MEKQQMLELIRRYVRTHVIASRRPVVLKLLAGGDRKSFIYQWEEYGGDVATAVRETVKASTTPKRDVTIRCKGFIDWLEGETKERYGIEWPPADVGNRLERIIYIMRALQTEQTNVVEYLSDKLWVNPRTIEDDLSVLLERDETASETLLGESLAVNGFSRGRGTVEFLSTVHPVLLLENLTSMTLTLHAILEKAEAPEQHDWLMTTARHIWRQLTDYAKERIRAVTVQRYGENGAVTAKLAQLDTELPEEKFVTEREASQRASDLLLYAMKAGEPCTVDYLDDMGRAVCTAGIPRFDRENHRQAILEHEDGSRTVVPFSRVVQCEIEAELR